MAEIRWIPFARHLRAEMGAHILCFKRGKLKKSGAGLAFFFLPMSTAIAEVPLDDRELSFLFHGRTADFQDVTVQGVLTFRVVDPERVARRIDFSIDLTSGAWREQPLEKLSLLLTQLGQQIAWGFIARSKVREVLAEGPQVIRDRMLEALTTDEGLTAMGLEVATVRVSQVAPTPEVEKALEAPARDAIQQTADEAAFARRANAVEHERAIQENELGNRIELARRREELIAREGANERREAEERAAAEQIGAEGDAQQARVRSESKAAGLEVMARAEGARTRLRGDAEASRIRAVEGAEVQAEKERMAVYTDTPVAVLGAIAARELAGKLTRIDHLNLSPDALGPLLQSLLSAGTARLEEAAAALPAPEPGES